MSVREISTFPDTTELWSAFIRDRCECHRSELISTFYPMVPRMARKIYRRLPSHAELEDVVSFGTFGLIQAVDIYEPGRCGACGHMHYPRAGLVTQKIDFVEAAYNGRLSGPCRSVYCRCGTPKLPDEKKSPSRYRFVRFETVAAAHIRGRILDEFRAIDWAPRSVRRRQREIDEATEALEAALGREPTSAEIADHITRLYEKKTEKTKEPALVVTPTDVVEWRHATDSARVRSLDEPVTEDGQSLEVEDRVVSSAFSTRSIHSAAMFVLEQMSPMKRFILMLRYYEEMKIEDIAKVMGVEVSRANQLHSEAVITFRDIFAAHLSRS